MPGWSYRSKIFLGDILTLETHEHLRYGQGIYLGLSMHIHVDGLGRAVEYAGCSDSMPIGHATLVEVFPQYHILVFHPHTMA